jgi:hypothetical protein
VLWRASRSGAQAASRASWRHSGRGHRRPEGTSAQRRESRIPKAALARRRAARHRARRPVTRSEVRHSAAERRPSNVTAVRC